jgi:two-component system sensor histidine kinase SenX3
VDVTTSTTDDEVAIAVADTGVGIPEDEQRQIFSRFFRSSVTRERHMPGTGLGLAIVQGIIEDHGGRVGVSSVLGSGTTFTVRLPAAPPDGDDRPPEVTARSFPGAGPEY